MKIVMEAFRNSQGILGVLQIKSSYETCCIDPNSSFLKKEGVGFIRDRNSILVLLILRFKIEFRLIYVQKIINCST